MIKKLEEDMENGLVDETERNRIAANAIDSCKKKRISDDLRLRILKALNLHGEEK